MYYADSWHDEQVFKRSHWFPTAGVREEWDGDEKLGGTRDRARRPTRHGPRGWRPPRRSWSETAAIDDLFNVRKQQFRALGESLSQGHHMKL